MVPEPGRDRRPFLASRIAREADFRRRVETADRLGIPGSQLDGREPVSTTRYVYDRRGRLLRSVTTSEPRWTEQDRAEALALALHRASLCPGGCGQFVADTTTHEDDGPEFVAHRTTCRACAELIDARSVVADGKAPSPHAGARLWHVEMRKR